MSRTCTDCVRHVFSSPSGEIRYCATFVACGDCAAECGGYITSRQLDFLLEESE